MYVLHGSRPSTTFPFRCTEYIPRLRFQYRNLNVELPKNFAPFKLVKIYSQCDMEHVRLATKIPSTFALVLMPTTRCPLDANVTRLLRINRQWRRILKALNLPSTEHVKYLIDVISPSSSYHLLRLLRAPPSFGLLAKLLTNHPEVFSRITLVNMMTGKEYVAVGTNRDGPIFILGYKYGVVFMCSEDDDEFLATCGVW